MHRCAAGPLGGTPVSDGRLASAGGRRRRWPRSRRRRRRIADKSTHHTHHAPPNHPPTKIKRKLELMYRPTRDLAPPSFKFVAAIFQYYNAFGRPLRPARATAPAALALRAAPHWCSRFLFRELGNAPGVSAFSLLRARQNHPWSPASRGPRRTSHVGHPTHTNTHMYTTPHTRLACTEPAVAGGTSQF